MSHGGPEATFFWGGGGGVVKRNLSSKQGVKTNFLHFFYTFCMIRNKNTYIEFINPSSGKGAFLIVIHSPK